MPAYTQKNQHRRHAYVMWQVAKNTGKTGEAYGTWVAQQIEADLIRLNGVNSSLNEALDEARATIERMESKSAMEALVSDLRDKIVDLEETIEKRDETDKAAKEDLRGFFVQYDRIFTLGMDNPLERAELDRLFAEINPL